MSTGKSERTSFANRLAKALKRAGKADSGPTALQREFNIRSASPITIHSARKWLVGEAIPTQEKLRTLAEWLQVSPDWLRYGEAPDNNADFNALGGLIEHEVRSLTDFRRLTESNRTIVTELIRVLLKSQK